VNDGAAGSSITLYDNTAASGAIIGIVNTASIATPTTLVFDCGFYTGLTVVIVNAVNVTVIYE